MQELTPDLATQIIKGGYWVVPPKKGAKMAIVYMGAVAPQALEAFEALREDNPDAGLMAITSAGY